MHQMWGFLQWEAFRPEARVCGQGRVFQWEEELDQEVRKGEGGTPVEICRRGAWTQEGGWDWGDTDGEEETGRIAAQLKQLNSEEGLGALWKQAQRGPWRLGLP